METKCTYFPTIVGTSNMAWIIYTLCVVAVVSITGLSHLVRSYRKQQSLKDRQSNKNVVLELVTENPYSGFYDEIDESMLREDTSFFVPQEGVYLTPGIEHNDKTDTDLYFENDEKEEENQKDDKLETDSMSYCSTDSNVAVQTDNQYLNPYHSLQENWKKDSHRYEVTVNVHQSNTNVLGSDEGVIVNK